MDVVFRDGKKPGVPREKHSTGIFYNVPALTPPQLLQYICSPE
jgi:hypothetical protein